MRILLIVVYYPPSKTSAAPLMRELAMEYVRQGHKVMVVTPSESVKGAKSVSDEDGVTVVRVRYGDIKHANKVLRLWRESRLSPRIWRIARDVFQENPCDLIVFGSPSIFFGELVRRLKALWGCPSFLILRDIFPQWAVDAGILRRGGLLHRYLRRKELEQYDAANIIGVEARGNLSYFNLGLKDNKYQAELLYNWVGATTAPSTTSGWRKMLGLEDKVVFFYGGNIGIAQDMDNIVRLATSLRDRDNLFFLIMGEGSEAHRLNLEIDRLALNNMRILPAIPEKEYMQCVSEFDVGLVTLDRRLKSHNFPGKILGYVACGKPILASLNPGNDSIDLLNNAGAGIACTNGEDEKLREAALLLASQPLVRERMGRNARALADTTLSVRRTAKQILSHSGFPASELAI
jgi:glycosyltransferase involved in cell wall biosynthesis